MSDVAELAGRLVEIESINPDMVAGGSGERGWLGSWPSGASAGGSRRAPEPAPGRPNVVAVARGSGGGRSLMLNAHMDTVGVAGMTDPFFARLEGGRLYGRGTYDMKGSLAACMLATAEAVRRGLRGDVILTAVSDEEFASVGTEAIAASVRADAAIVTEPTELQVAVAHRGFVALEVEVHGRAAHGSRPELGIDAIAKMGRVLVGIEELDARCARIRGTGSWGVAACTRPSSRAVQEFSSYPARCLLQAERRTIPGEMAGSRAGAAGDRRASWRGRSGLLSQCASTDLARAVRGVGGRGDRRSASPSRDVRSRLDAGDGRRLLLGGLRPSRGRRDPDRPLRPIGEGAHAEIEWVDVTSLERCVKIYSAVAVDVCV